MYKILYGKKRFDSPSEDENSVFRGTVLSLKRCPVDVDDFNIIKFNDSISEPKDAIIDNL